MSGPTDAARARFLRRTLEATLAVAFPSMMVASGMASASDDHHEVSMHTRPIPSSGESLPVIGCGTWQGFDVRDTKEALAPLAAVVDALSDAGGTVLDSSPMYGRSEAVTGKLLAASRHRAFVATKVWTRGRQAGIDQMNASLASLGHVDLMQVHNLVDWQTQLATLREWQAERRIRYVGVTHYTSSAYRELEAVLKSEPLDFVQVNYAWDDRDAEARILPLAAERGVAVLVNRPFGGGDLLRRLRDQPLPSWATAIGATTWSQVLLKFVLSHPARDLRDPGHRQPAAHDRQRRCRLRRAARSRVLVWTGAGMKAQRLMVGIAAIAFASASAAAPSGRTPQALQAAVTALESRGFAGVIVLGDHDGTMAEFAIGEADREAHRPHRVDQRWLWASVTKQVTATLVMRRVDAGQLALDDTVASRLSAFSGPTGGRITVRQLLQHTSGLPNPNDTPSSADEMPLFYRERGAAIGDTARALGYCAGPPLAQPGEKFAYDNCDYLVLVALLEKVTGKPYATLVDEEIASPIGATTLRVAPDGAAGGGSDVIGYQDASRRFPATNVATFGGSGALVGSARDLLAFDRASMAYLFLSKAATDVLWTGDPGLGYEALGVWSFNARLRGCRGDVHLVERRGDVEGIQVRNVIAPETGRALVVFTNDASVDFGEVWQGRGLAFDLLSAALCDLPS